MCIEFVLQVNKRMRVYLFLLPWYFEFQQQDMEGHIRKNLGREILVGHSMERMKHENAQKISPNSSPRLPPES